MNRVLSGLTSFLFLFVLCAAAVAAPLQNIYGSLTGAVTDDSGAVIPGVSVTATHVGTGVSRSAVTDERGNYRIPLLPIGQYSLAAELPGFKKEVRSGITLQVDQTGREDFRLSIGNVSDVVEVTAGAPLVASETSSVGNVIDSTKVVELPLNGRDFKNLALLVPNAMPTGQGTTHASRGGFNVAGSRETSNNFLLDGIDNNDPTVNLFTVKPSIEIVQEFKVQTNSYTAESGRYSGGQINIMTKSGTNGLHGSLFEFFRNQRFDAKNFFDNGSAPIPPFRRNQFGGSLGGPIIKGRTHFFGAFEGTRIKQSETLLASVPTAEFLRGDFSALLSATNPWTRRVTQVIEPSTRQPFPGNIVPEDRFSPIAKKVMALYPSPNRADPVLNFLSNPLSTDDTNQYSYRIDHQITNSLRTFLRHSISWESLLDSFDHFHRPTRLPGWGRTEPTHTQHIVLNTSWVINPKMINELRLGYNRFQQSRSAINKDDGAALLGLSQFLDTAAEQGLNRGYPFFSINGFDAIGSSSGQPQQRQDNTYQIVNNFSYVTGSHALKAGLDLLRFEEYDIINTNIRGNFTFNGQYTTAGSFGFSDFLLGFPSQTARLILPEQYRYMFHYQHGFYVQDDWKALPNLTINMGLRYEIDGPIRDIYNRVGRFDPVKNQIILARVKDPRFDPAGGLKDLIARYYPSDKTPIVVNDQDTVWNTDHNNFAPRIGLAYRPFSNNSTVARAGYGVYYDGMVFGNGFAGFGPSITPFRFAQSFIASTTTPNIDMSSPFPDALAGGTLSPATMDSDYHMPYSQQYNAGVEHELINDVVVEIGYVGNMGTRLSRSRNINAATPSATGFSASRRPFSWLGNLSYRESTARSYYHSGQVRVEKRFSHGYSLLSSYTWGKAIDNDSGSEGAGGAGPQDPNELNANKGLSSFDVRHRYSLSYTAQLPVGAGKRFGAAWPKAAQFALGGWEIAGIWTMQTGRPITVTYSGDNSGTGNNNDRPNLIGDANLPADQRTPDRWFNIDAFVMPARGVFGNAGRGVVEGPGYQNMDFSIKKDFHIGENQNVQFRAEFFNFTNHPNFDYPNRTVNNSQFGKIVSAGLSRQLQFGLRYAF
jgi:hypothetical protein